MWVIFWKRLLCKHCWHAKYERMDTGGNAIYSEMKECCSCGKWKFQRENNT